MLAADAAIGGRADAGESGKVVRHVCLVVIADRVRDVSDARAFIALEAMQRPVEAREAGEPPKGDSCRRPGAST
jgi:hypothetical protein